MNLIRPLFACFFTLAATGCFGPIGNSDATCTAGSACVCSGIGNCDRECPSGGCDFVCRGTTNCNFTCTGGDCSVACENTGNCILECSGGDCDITCDSTGNCICENGCESPADGGLPDSGV